MTETEASVDYRIDGDIAILNLNNPPVNGLSLPLRQAFVQSIKRACADPAVRAIVLSGAGRGFCAGGDIGEFGSDAATAPPGVSSHMHPAIEASEKPVVAAIHGLAIGGGLETAMVCHYRIAMADSRIALPEVTLGTIPLSGTQRLPRLIGLLPTIDMIGGAQSFTARNFAGTPLFDQIIEPDETTGSALQVMMAAVAFARNLLCRPKEALPLVRNIPLNEPQAETVIAAARDRYHEDPRNPAPARAVEAIEAAYRAKDFDDGLEAARHIWKALMASEHVRVLRDEFFAKSRARVRPT